MQRGVTHDKVLNFKTTGAIAERAKRNARKRGMTLSEYLRHVLREDLENARN